MYNWMFVRKQLDWCFLWHFVVFFMSAVRRLWRMNCALIWSLKYTYNNKIYNKIAANINTNIDILFWCIFWFYKLLVFFFYLHQNNVMRACCDDVAIEYMCICAQPWTKIHSHIMREIVCVLLHSPNLHAQIQVVQLRAHAVAAAPLRCCCGRRARSVLSIRSLIYMLCFFFYILTHTYIIYIGTFTYTEIYILLNYIHANVKADRRRWRRRRHIENRRFLLSALMFAI